MTSASHLAREALVKNELIDWIEVHNVQLRAAIEEQDFHKAALIRDEGVAFVRARIPGFLPDGPVYGLGIPVPDRPHPSTRVLAAAVLEQAERIQSLEATIRALTPSKETA